MLDSEWESVKSSTDSAWWKLEHCQRPWRHNPAEDACREKTSGLQPATEKDGKTNETSSTDGDSHADQLQAEVPF